MLLGALCVLTGTVAAQDEPVFVTAELDRARVFVGEQLIYTVTAYTDAEREIVFYPPDFEGFWHGEMRDPFSGAATLNGKQYNAAIFQISLYPLRDGTLSIGRPRAQFIDTGTEESVIVSGEPLTVEAVPVPPAPDGFAGLVGAVIPQLTVEPTTIRLGEAVRISLRLSGSANLAANPAPELVLPQAWRLYDDVTQTEASFGGALATQEITLRWMAVPDEAGTVQVGVAPFKVFDPRTGFVDVTVPAVRVDVLPAADGSIRRDTTAIVPSDALPLVDDVGGVPAPAWLLWVFGPVLAVAALMLPTARSEFEAWRRKRRARQAFVRFQTGLRRASDAYRIAALGDLVRRYLADVGMRDVSTNSAAASVLTELEGLAYAPDTQAVMPHAIDRAHSFVKAVEERRNAVAG
ncbi:MAG: BatD family protein [Chloroflexi bacterium]|nr:BatD family protein [Chloroflexota bacterium]